MKKLFARKRPVSRLRRFSISVTVALLIVGAITQLTAHPVSAAGVIACAPGNILFDSITNVYCNATADWMGRALAIAQKFFFSLVAVEMAWSAILYVLQKDNLGELLTSWLIKMMGIFFFYAIILNANVWLPAIMNSFMQLGNIVTNKPIVLDPEMIFEGGVAFCNMIFTTLPQANFPGWEGLGNISGTITDNLTVVFEMFVSVVFAGLCCLIIFAAFFVIAGQLVMTMIEAYIMISAGAVMLGFMGSRWTMSWGERFIGYAMSIGIKLFVIFVIIGLGQTLEDSWSDILNNGVHATVFDGAGSINKLSSIVQWYLNIAAGALIFMMLVMKLPALASSMMNGSPSMSMGGAMSTAGAVAGAVTGIAAGVASAVGGAISKADSAVNALKDASAVDDKIGALAKEGAADALGDAAQDAAAQSATEDVLGGPGDAAASMLEGDAEVGADALSASPDGESDSPAMQGDGPSAEEGGMSGSSSGDALRTTSEESNADHSPATTEGGATAELGDLDAPGPTAQSADLVNAAANESATGTGNSSVPTAAQVTKAQRDARDSRRDADRSSAERERASHKRSARNDALGAAKSIAGGAASSASAAMRMVTELDEGASSAGGSAQVSLRMPE